MALHAYHSYDYSMATSCLAVLNLLDPNLTLDELIDVTVGL